MTEKNEALSVAVASIVSAAIRSGIVRTTEEVVGLTGDVYRRISGDTTGTTVHPSNGESRPANGETEVVGSDVASPSRGWRPQVTGRDVDHIVCLECGNHFKSLGMHLRRHGMTPSEYRVKHGIPEETPLACIDYSEKRRAIAKRTVAAYAKEQARQGREHRRRS